MISFTPRVFILNVFYSVVAVIYARITFKRERIVFHLHNGGKHVSVLGQQAMQFQGDLTFIDRMNLKLSLPLSLYCGL